LYPTISGRACQARCSLVAGSFLFFLGQATSSTATSLTPDPCRATATVLHESIKLFSHRSGLKFGQVGIVQARKYPGQT